MIENYILCYSVRIFLRTFISLISIHNNLSIVPFNEHEFQSLHSLGILFCGHFDINTFIFLMFIPLWIIVLITFDLWNMPLVLYLFFVLKTFMKLAVKLPKSNKLPILISFQLVFKWLSNYLKIQLLSQLLLFRACFIYSTNHWFMFSFSADKMTIWKKM